MDHPTTRFWPNGRVLVTGATGFLGSWLVDGLVARRAHVVCLLRDWVPASGLVQAGTIEKTTVRVAAAYKVGVRFCSLRLNSCTGSGVAPGPTRNRDSGTLSKLMSIARIDDATTAWRIAGRLICRFAMLLFL